MDRMGCEYGGKVGYVPLSEELESSSSCSTIVMYNPIVCSSDLKPILGLPCFLSSDCDSDKRPGLVYSLVVINQNKEKYCLL